MSLSIEEANLIRLNKSICGVDHGCLLALRHGLDALFPVRLNDGRVVVVSDQDRISLIEIWRKLGRPPAKLAGVTIFSNYLVIENLLKPKLQGKFVVLEKSEVYILCERKKNPFRWLTINIRDCSLRSC